MYTCTVSDVLLRKSQKDKPVILEMRKRHQPSAVHRRMASLRDSQVNFATSSDEEGYYRLFLLAITKIGFSQETASFKLPTMTRREAPSWNFLLLSQDRRWYCTGVLYIQTVHPHVCFCFRTTTRRSICESVCHARGVCFGDCTASRRQEAHGYNRF